MLIVEVPTLFSAATLTDHRQSCQEIKERWFNTYEKSICKLYVMFCTIYDFFQQSGCVYAKEIN